MRFVRTCYRAHDPRWAFKPTSGDGAAIRGARFNPKGVPALYLGLTIMTAVKEANQGFAHRIDPCVLCSYEVDCDDIVDLTTEEAATLKGLLRDCIPDLKREIARADDRHFRHELVQREELCERLIVRLDDDASGTKPAPSL